MADGFVFQQVGRPRLICFKNCQDVEISGLHLQKQAIWCLHLLYCQNVKVENLNIDSVARTPSSDGMDIDSCSNIEISHCTISCNDDDITLKSGKDNDGRRVNRPTENVWIHDCDIRLGDGIAMGSEVTGSVRHVLVENCTFTNTNHAARIKSQPSRGGIVEDIVYRDIVLKNPGEAVDFELAWDLRLQRLPAVPNLTICRDIHLIRFSGVARSGGTMAGVDGGPNSDVHFQDCNFSAQRGLRISHAVDIDTSGLNLKVQNGPPIIMGGAPTTRPVAPPA
jgi:polygalacturonase